MKTYTTFTQLKNKLGNLSPNNTRKSKAIIKLKDHEHVELETNNLINVLQNAAKKANPNSEPQSTTNNTPYEIKRLIAEKRKARSTWQRTHTPDSKKKYNQTSNKLKSKLQRNAERII